MEFIVPGMQIDESDVGTRSTNQLSLSGIGIVGTFQKGPVNTPTTIGDETAYTKMFGTDQTGLTGPKSVKGCFAQGANDLRIVRIVGAGAASAVLTLQDNASTPEDSIVVTATSPGTWGNSLKATVKVNGSGVDITVTDGDSLDSFKGINSLDSLPITKNLVTISKAAEATKLPAVTADEPLTGGNDGAAVTDAEYIGTITPSGKRSGLKALEPIQCGLALCAQQYSAIIHQALITWAENCDIEEGLRIPILNSAPTLGIDAACVQTVTLDTADGRGITTYPWVTPEDETNDDIVVAPDGYYAGRLAVLNPCQSPSNKQILGIRKLERDFTYAEVKVLTLARISPITLVPNRGFRIRNGVTLSSDTAWGQTNIRRQQDKMEMELYHAMQWAISENHDQALWDAISTQADAYLRTQQNLGFIMGFLPTLCNSQTNPDENILARILTFVVRWKPLYAADFIIMKMKRELPSATA
ncbi:MAG: hypothetical protein K0R55_228 [Sporomusa sp.]|nr:hypothetical protein [Sporomusa sp.]